MSLPRIFPKNINQATCMILLNLNFLQGGDIGAAPCQNCAVCYIRINEVIINLLKLFLPPQGFGPNGQNPRRHPRGPRILGRKISP